MGGLRHYITLIEAEDRVFYHVTMTRNLRRIAEQGLVPRRGPRSRAGRETRPAVYLFQTRDDAENALENWLTDHFAETTAMALLRITLPPQIEVHEVGWERQVWQPIPPACIEIIDRNFGG